MSGSNTAMKASLILMLQDRLSAGLGALKQRLDGIRQSAERIGALGAIGSGLAIGAPIVAAARFDDQLRSTAITAGLSGAAAEAYIAKLRRNFQRLALDTSQTSEAVAQAAGLMIARGLPSELIDKLLPVAARVATGAGAALSDVAGVVESVNSALGVTPDKLDRAMTMLVLAAKEGKVELRDMAKEFPALASRAAAFGLQGLRGVETLGAALQIAAKAAATPSEAATNLANLFQSFTRPETIKNFKEMGVDFPKMLKQAEKLGLNPFEVSLRKIMDLTKGDPITLGRIIGDMQAGNALMPFLKDFGKEYLRVRDVLNAGQGDDVIMRDFLTRMQGPAARLTILMERLEQLSRRFGESLFGRIGTVAWPLERLMDLMEYIDGLAPDLIGNSIQWGAALLGVVSVLGVLVAVLPILGAGLRVVLLPFRLLGMAVPLLLAALKGMALLFGTIAAPIAAVVAVLVAIGAAAYTVWAHWERFEIDFAHIMGGLRAAGQGLIRFLDGIFSADMGKIAAGWNLLWEGMGTAASGVLSGLRNLMRVWGEYLSKWLDEYVTPFVASFKGIWTELEGWFSGLWDRMIAPINRWVTAIREALAPFARRFGIELGDTRADPDPGEGHSAGAFVRAPPAPPQRVELTVTAPAGVVGDIRTPDTWTTRREEMIDAYRPRRGPASPTDRP